jgi:hypothetical protein
MIIDFEKTKTLWYGGIKPNRREKLEKNLSSLNIKAKHIEPYISNHPYSGVRIGCAKSHLKALEESLKYDEPVLILEDDVDSTDWYCSKIEIPDDTDAFYVGTCLNGINHNWALTNVDGGCCGCPLPLERYEFFYRIHGMLTTHAILYCSKVYKEYCIDLLNKNENGRHIDVLFAANMFRHKIYAPKKPLFFQNCELENKDAFIKTKTPLETIFY